MINFDDVMIFSDDEIDAQEHYLNSMSVVLGGWSDENFFLTMQRDHGVPARGAVNVVFFERFLNEDNALQLASALTEWAMGVENKDG